MVVVPVAHCARFPPLTSFLFPSPVPPFITNRPTAPNSLGQCPPVIPSLFPCPSLPFSLPFPPFLPVRLSLSPCLSLPFPLSFSPFPPVHPSLSSLSFSPFPLVLLSLSPVFPSLPPDLLYISPLSFSLCPSPPFPLSFPPFPLFPSLPCPPVLLSFSPCSSLPFPCVLLSLSPCPSPPFPLFFSPFPPCRFKLPIVLVRIRLCSPNTLLHFTIPIPHIPFLLSPLSQPCSSTLLTLCSHTIHPPLLPLSPLS
ncbi:unnamed protein product [Closterium sp. Naga37s-1]|nr:unnamed protein product [Closterium sp. Naga37s-1]